MLKLIYSYICDACGKKEEKGMVLDWGYIDLPRPITPDNWTKIEEQLFCPKHKVKWKIEPV